MEYPRSEIFLGVTVWQASLEEPDLYGRVLLNEEPPVYDRTPGADPEFRVTHTLNNNAVVARSSAGLSVLVGTGIGFGKKVDDVVDADAIQQRYFAVEPDKVHYMAMLDSVNPDVLRIISASVDRASELLGELHPSIYLLLTDHIIFAIERFRDGHVIRNALTSEIHTIFSEEFAAALDVLHFVNAELGLDLPYDEAAYIALHLNAARSGESVKQPLNKANALAGIVDSIITKMGATSIAGPLRKELTEVLVRLVERIETGRTRPSAAARSIKRDLPREWEYADWIIATILGEEKAQGRNTHALIPTASIPPEQRSGETACLAVFLNGWSHDLK